MLLISRRSLVLGGTAFAALAGLPSFRPVRADERPALPIPAELRADPGGTIRLDVRAGQRQYATGGPTPTLGINGDYLGPALRLARGQKVAIEVRNRLTEATTMHWHGLEVPGDADGGPHNPIPAGASWTAELAIDQPAATCWFHPHNYPSTAEQVLKGLAGLFIIDDEETAGLGLPMTWGLDDIPLILQDRRFNADGSFFHRFNLVAVVAGYIGDRLLVNGAEYPVATTARGWLRFRLLNGSNARSYRIAASDGRALHVIASDGGLLAAPATVQELPLAAGERYEILVDARDGKAFDLVTLPVPGQLGMALPPFHEALPFVTVVPDGAESHGTLPDALATLPPRDSDLPAVTQQLDVAMLLDAQGMAAIGQAGLTMPGMDHGTMGHDMKGMEMKGSETPQMPLDPAVVERMTALIVDGPALPLAEQLAANTMNGKPFEMHGSGFSAARGTNLRWLVSEGTDMMFHPIHIHGCQFRILSLGGKPPEPYQAGRKDTVLLGMGAQQAELQIRFDHPAPADRPYMAHCHILEHEDSGMMTHFTVG